MRAFRYGVVLGLVLGMQACERQSPPPAQQVVPSPVTQPGNVPPKLPQITLAVPPLWEGRYRLEETRDAEADRLVPHARQIVEYIYQPVDTAQNEQSIVMLITLLRADWQKIVSEPGPPLGQKLAEQGDYVIVVALSQELGYAKDSEDARRYGEILPALETIKGALRIDGEVPAQKSAAEGNHAAPESISPATTAIHP